MGCDCKRENTSLSPADWWRQLLRQKRAIAVIRVRDYECGIQQAKAVAAGGIDLLEITWDSITPAKLIAQLRKELPHCTLGTGTILSAGNLKAAIAAGIEFAFTPHCDPCLIQIARDRELPVVAGALTPTEIMAAWQAGATCVKVFPVQSLGGAGYIKALQGPLSHIPLIPTGGVTLDSAQSFIAAGAIAVGLSGQLFPQEALHHRNWQEITRLARQLVSSLEDNCLKC